jgi:hypothetical protein
MRELLKAATEETDGLLRPSILSTLCVSSRYATVLAEVRQPQEANDPLVVRLPNGSVRILILGF